MRTLLWVAGLLRRRPLQLLAVGVSVAWAIAFAASLGAFVTSSHAALTVRAAASVPADWQVQVTAQGDAAAVRRAVARVPGLRANEPVSIAKVQGLRSSTAGGARQTGAAYVVGISPTYLSHFPAEVRRLLGTTHGNLLLQQTAANLAAAPEDAVTVVSGGTQAAVRVDGVVDMPSEDSFFQVVGLPQGAGVSAPPDNVLLVPSADLPRLTHGSRVVQQLHVALDHASLPHDPQTAAIAVQSRAHRFQADATGGALVGDNLGSALTAAGEDARYADLLFLLLGLPGLTLATVVVALVVSLRSDRRRREVALLRLRGATVGDVVRVAAGEGLFTAVVGVVLGIPLAALTVRLALPAGTTLPLPWVVGASLAGFVLALVVQTAPTARLAVGDQHVAVAAEAARMPSARSPWPLRYGLDVVLVLAALGSFVLAARSGYQVVLAPEGIPQTQVDYATLAGPVLAWPGLALLLWRITAWVAGRRRPLWPARSGRGAPELEHAVLRRRRRVIARGAVGLAAAVALAVSTAVFATTYHAQSRVDVALTVGSDVAVVEPPGASIGPSGAGRFRGLTGVKSVEPLQHRFGYVGPDLQDLYGVRPASFGQVTSLQDAFVPGSTIADVLGRLRRTPDGVLLSAETLHDYQLHPGDLIRIRLQSGPGSAYRPVPFHVVGQVSEWPTAPKDSFIVANADYIARRTGSDAVGTFLISSDTPHATAGAVRAALAHDGVAARVQDTSTASAGVTSASGLAATDLSGLSRLILGFSILLAVACSGLALGAGIAERRRALVLLAALGATSRQRGRFLALEARTLVGSGIVGGAVIGSAVAYLLVKVLTGIFDPPPSAPTVPWTYLVSLVLLICGVTAVVVTGLGRRAARAGASELRDL